MNKAEEMKHLNKIGQILLEFTPARWKTINCTVALVGNLGQSWKVATLQDGEEQFFDTPLELFNQFESLRSTMYQPGRGTWFSANFILTPPGSFRVEYNYDTEVEFSQPQPDNIDYREDFDIFPRDPEHIPDWLQEKLREAEQE